MASAPWPVLKKESEKATKASHSLALLLEVRWQRVRWGYAPAFAALPHSKLRLSTALLPQENGGDNGKGS